MGLLERLFGPATKPSPTEPEVRDGHVHGPDAAPDDVVLPKTKRSSRSGLAGKPPGWKRQVTENSGGVWPWSGGSGDGGHYSGGSGGDGGGGGGS